MYLRESAKEFDANCTKGGAGNKARLKAIVKRGDEPGLIAYDSNTPVGWVSVPPREQYVRVLRSPLHKPFDAKENVSSIACFFIAKSARGQGVADRLLQAALEHATTRGARTIDAYPIDTDSRQPAAEMWRGSL
ncbi:MAG: GNAT family N-acetyltransferase, partial [Gammaproteobacteria bacterium]|nr:GNAT family N-acetyltransferase [Gammaproteobacteria bacterium]